MIIDNEIWVGRKRTVILSGFHLARPGLGRAGWADAGVANSDFLPGRHRKQGRGVDSATVL